MSHSFNLDHKVSGFMDKEVCDETASENDENLYKPSIDSGKLEVIY